VVDLGGRVVAASGALGGGDRAALGAGISAVPAGGDAPVELMIGGERYLAIAAPLPGYRGEAALRFVVLRSLDQALAPAAQISLRLWAMAAISLLSGAVLAMMLARRLSEPLDELVAFTERLASGALSERATPSGPIEVRALGEAMNRMAGELAESRGRLLMQERLEQEMEISARIQTSILPRSCDVDGLEVSAQMFPAAEVGGDYYDILPVRGGTWIGIGDVAGHGLRSGLVMLMLQSAVSALARQMPLSAPSELLWAVNRVLYENIRNRLAQDEHVTLTLLRYRRDGVLTFAGAHEEIIVYRAATGRCELVPTPGPWVGVIEDIAGVTEDSRIELEDGDVVVLYTDGLTEARNPEGRQYGLEPVIQAVEAHGGEAVEQIRDEILRGVAEWTTVLEDDLTLVVMRYRAPQARIA
ncbi:MAG TPA: SpoIIE family protein phosphatase, partial [Candidatus Nanopelagicales bacterium]|nr:SpoIIE family protein phosphatase [Candidatus Nanopelagicales bacterium]